MAKAKKNQWVRPASNKRHPLTFPVSLLRFLKARSPAFAALPERQRHYFAGMLYSAHFRPLRHADDPDAQVHHWYERYQACRGSHLAAYCNLGWWKKTLEADRMANRAAGYELTPEGQGILDLWLSSMDDQPEVGIMDSQGKVIRMAKTAINPRTMTSDSAKRSPGLVVPVEIDGDNLHCFSDAADAWIYREPCPAGFEWAHAHWDAIQADRGPNGGRDRAEARVLKAKRQAALMGAEAKSTKAPGHIIGQTYIEAPSGRLYAEAVINMQNCLREVKRAALAGQWEYDFENCHWALLYQSAQSIGIDLPTVREYLENKNAWRQEIALAAGISVADAKECIIAIVYGAALRADSRLRIPEVIGVDATKRLRQCQKMRDLYADVKRARPEIINAHRKPGGLINIAGRKYKAPEKISTDRSPEAAQLAHILQGAESEALRACIAIAGPTLTLLQHDGFTSRERLSVADLEAAVFERTGYRLEVSEERL